MTTNPHKEASSMRSKKKKKTSTVRLAMPHLPVPPELSDEAAAQIQHFLSEWFLWFSATYRDQIRRYYEPWHYVPPRHRIDDPF